MLDSIKVKGARQHNLKNLSVDIPKNKFVVFTGVSGSGKSSLAFDTIYAEGQRRYVESLSAYARQFLGIMDKPDVDLIEGLSPSISIDQKSVSHNPRSTVGTLTEIFDFLRFLFARIGHPHCPNCGKEISKLSVDEIVQKMTIYLQDAVVSNKIEPHQFIILSPILSQKKGEFKDLFENLRSKGFRQARIDGKIINLSDDIDLIKANKHSLDVVIDTLSFSFKDFKNSVLKANITTRLTNDVEQATNLSDGLVILEGAKRPIRFHNKDSNDINNHLYSEKFSCPNCNISLPEIEPRMFSFNSPLGACIKCKGIGSIFRVNPELILNKNLSVNEGGIVPFAKFFLAETWYIRLIKQVAYEQNINLDIAISLLSKDKLNTLLYGTNKIHRVLGTNRFGKKTAIYEKFDGIVGELERRYFETQGDFAVLEIQKYMKEELCPSCQGNKLKSEILSITINNKNISDITKMSVNQLIDFIKEQNKLKLSSYENQISTPIFKEIITRLTFLQNVGL